MKQIVIAGIGTGIGKTFIASILAEALEADYWKPIQAGNLHFTDTDFVKKHVSNKRSFFHSEAYRLSQPMSPHAAAEIDGISIELSKLDIPETTNNLIIELAGGLMVPLNRNELNIHLLEQWKLPVILVIQNYLGSINHSLLSVELLLNRGIPILGIIFNGERNKMTESFIENYTKLNCIAKIEMMDKVDEHTVTYYANQFKEIFKIH